MDKTIGEFDFYAFEAHWETFSESQKKILIQKAADADPRIGIIPVLAGMTSYHPRVRDSAKESFDIIQSRISSLLSAPCDEKNYRKGMEISAAICSRLYALLHSRISPDERDYFFQILLETNGKGPFFAFRALYRELLPLDAMEKIILTAPEHKRLALVEQFLQTSPTERLKLGFTFKRILKSITQRETVVEFFADLFDRRQNPDPFLYNISQEIRDPDQITANEIRSESAERRIMGLKALSMLTTRHETELLIDILANDEQDVRIAVYHIIENSPLGTYPELFEKILPFFYARDQKEALPAFMALVVSGKFPLDTVLDMVTSNYPEFMPVIHREIEGLSKLSFFLLQDIALNHKAYLDKHVDVNLSCVLGMTKKRPERVVKLLEKLSRSKGLNNHDVNQFIDKAKQLLIQEKNSIEAEFQPAIELAKKKVLEQSAKSDALIQQKILSLKTKKPTGVKSFQGETINNCDLSYLFYSGSALIFSKCIFYNCNFSKASFQQTFFRKTIFYNIDMRTVRFEGVTFDHSIFINVNAKDAIFRNCSFQNTFIYNCNFSNTDVKDASFVSSTISKASFNLADLSGSCFTSCKISAVSFETAMINRADFSNVSARFCKFPYHAKLGIVTENTDYNARKFQLSPGDMPVLQDTVLSEINMMLFCEFIHYGEEKFIRQNQQSLMAAFDIFDARQADLFQLIPFLLHENCRIQDTVRFNDQTPCGIFNYIPSPESEAVIKKYTDPATYTFSPSQAPAIEALFTIGSIGSIAQTSTSDIDYWVCINEQQMTDQDIALLKMKLEAIEHLAIDRFNIQVTFFLVDILKARNNDFGDSTIESSGSAQARLLKEEFYRTMIHIAGKIPFWAVLPSAVSINYYNDIFNNITFSPDLSRYIDLGDIHAIPKGEYFGASIWQMFKWLKSPFKSVIKMALLEKYVYEYGNEALLSNKYKDEWMNSGTYLKPEQNDSYFFLLQHLVQYFETVEDEYSVILLLNCFFLKLGICEDSQIDNTVFGLRKTLLEKCMKKWGWEKSSVYEIGNYKSWQYSEIVYLSDTIKSYMIEKYKTVNKRFNRQFQGQALISPEDQTILGRKVYTAFSKQPDKIEKVLLVSRNDLYYKRLYLKYNNEDNGNDRWELLNKGSKTDAFLEDSLFKAKTIEEIGAWLINNNIYNEDRVVRLIPNPIDITHNDIEKLFKAMFGFFTPLLSKAVHFSNFLEPEKVVALFVSTNFYTPVHQKKIMEYAMIYLNSWGEMFHKSIRLNTGLSTMKALKEDIRNRIGLTRVPAMNKTFYFSK